MNRRTAVEAKKRTWSVTPLAKSILDRARSSSHVEQEELRSSEHSLKITGESRFNHDFSQIPAHTDESAITQDQQSVSCPVFPRRCPFGGACHTCPVGRQIKSNVQPGKALGETPEQGNREKPSPEQGGATIQCDGSGGYEIVYNGWAGATCGTKACVTAHENSHIADWKAKWPTGCKGQSRGYLPKGDPPDKPLMTVAEYNAFLKKSECKAHTVDLICAEALPKPKGCKKTVEDYISLTRRQKAKWCPSSLSRGAKVALGVGGGALVGAGIGALAGGPVGAAIGAGIGAAVGGVAGLLL